MWAETEIDRSPRGYQPPLPHARMNGTSLSGPAMRSYAMHIRLCIRVISTARLPLMVSASRLITAEPYTALRDHVSVLWMNARASYYRPTGTYVKLLKERTRGRQRRREEVQNWKMCYRTIGCTYEHLSVLRALAYRLLPLCFALFPEKERKIANSICARALAA